MSINLNVSQVQIRDNRLGAITAYNGDAKTLIEKSKTKSADVHTRSYSQCSDCSQGCAETLVYHIRGAAVVTHAPIGCNAPVAAQNLTARAVSKARGQEPHSVHMISDERDHLFHQSQRFGVWPLDAITISAEFGPFWYSTEEMPALHTGLDLKSDKGEEIHAAQAGTVVFAGWDGSYGYRVAVSHGAGLETWYAHCSELLVEEGDAVEQGQTIALVGVTGYSTGPHLHFEVRLDGESVDPMDYLEGDGRIGANTGKAAFQEYPGLEKMDFEKITQGLLASGLDAEYVQWTPDEDRIGGGWLYFVNPRFAHPYFEGVTVEGSAQWEPGPYSFSKYTMLSFDLTKSSELAGAVTGPTLGCLVDLAGNRIVSKSGVPWEGEEIELTDEDILQIAAYFSLVLKGAQDAWSELAE